MEKFQILYGFILKQKSIIAKILNEVTQIDLKKYENQYVFALKTQQFYTAIEDIFIRIAKTFENSIQDISKYHTELLQRMSIEVLNIRPKVICEKTFTFLNKLRSFRHFIRHAYDFELDFDELFLVQKKIIDYNSFLLNDLEDFEKFLLNLTN